MIKELKKVWLCSLVGDWHLAKCGSSRLGIGSSQYSLGGRDGQEVQVDGALLMNAAVRLDVGC